MKTRILIGLIVCALLAGAAAAASLSYSLAPGDSVLVSCANALLASSLATNQVSVACAANTATPTPAPTATAPALAAVDPLILGTCPAAVHDRYVVTGPDGQLYRTWHPQVVAIDPANPGAGTCAFAHEHG